MSKRVEQKRPKRFRKAKAAEEKKIDQTAGEALPSTASAPPTATARTRSALRLRCESSIRRLVR